MAESHSNQVTDIKVNVWGLCNVPQFSMSHHTLLAQVGAYSISSLGEDGDAYLSRVRNRGGGGLL